MLVLTYVGLAKVSTGLYLILFSIKGEVLGDQPADRA
jgi:hypothetical protein